MGRRRTQLQKLACLQLSTQPNKYNILVKKVYYHLAKVLVLTCRK